MRRLVLGLLALIGLALPASAATCTWQGGTATWDHTNTASWSCGHFPVSTDTVVFDATSGGGTVTVAAVVSGDTFLAITWGAFTGTLDFATHPVSITMTSATCFSGTGSGTRVFSGGTSTFTCSITTAAASLFTIGTTTNCTCTTSGITVVFSGASSALRGFIGGGLSYSVFTVSSNLAGGSVNITGANTFGTLNYTGPGQLIFPSAATNTITNAAAWTSASGTTLLIGGSAGSAATIHFSATSTAGATGSPWAARDITANTSTFTLTGYDEGGNSGITFSSPVAGSGNGIIGGGM